MLQRIEHRRSMRRRQHIALTCDYDMRENDAGVPNKLQRRKKTRNVQRHVGLLQNRSCTATIKRGSELPSRRFLYAISVGPRRCTMALTRTAAKIIDSREAHRNDGAGNDLQFSTKQRQHPQGEPLNLDVLVLVRAFPFLFACPSPINTMVTDRCIRPPSRVLEPCTHLQILPGVPDGQIFGARVEDRSLQNQGPPRLPDGLDRT